MAQPINRYNPSLSRQAEMEQQGYGSYSQPNMASKAGSIASSVPNPWFQAAGLGLQAVGSMQAGDDAQRAYELQIMAYNAQRDREARLEEEARQQRILDNIAQGGTYAQGLVKNAQNTYGSYARQTGL